MSEEEKAVEASVVTDLETKDTTEEKLEEKTFDYSTLIKYVPLGGVFLVLLSAIKLIYFYKIFNINITGYIYISEYIPLFIDDLFEYLMILSLSFILNLVYNKNDVFAINKVRLQASFKQLALVILLTLTVINTLFNLINRDVIGSNTVLIILFASVLLLFFIYLFYIKKSNSFVFIFSVLFIYHCSSPVITAMLILNKSDKLNYSIVMKNDTVVTDDNIHYLGKTQDYTFVYYVSEKRTRILKNENIEEVEVFQKLKKARQRRR